MNIYIANLHFSVEESELEQLFKQYGQVNSVKLMMDKKKNKSKGFAFVDINPNPDIDLVKILDGKEIRGRTTKVSIAKTSI